MSTIELLLAYGARAGGNQGGEQLDALLLEALADARPAFNWVWLDYGGHRVSIERTHLQATPRGFAAKGSPAQNKHRKTFGEHHELST